MSLQHLNIKTRYEHTILCQSLTPFPVTNEPLLSASLMMVLLSYKQKQINKKPKGNLEMQKPQRSCSKRPQLLYPRMYCPQYHPGATGQTSGRGPEMPMIWATAAFCISFECPSLEALPILLLTRKSGSTEQRRTQKGTVHVEY